MLQFWLVSNTIMWPFFVSIGGLQLGLNVVALALAGTVWFCIKHRIAKRSLWVVAGLLAYLTFSFSTEMAGPCRDKLAKFFITAPLLLFLVLLGAEIGRKATTQGWINLRKTAAWTLLAAFSAFMVEMALPSYFANQGKFRSNGEYSGFFSEPSHVAFGLFPCIAVLLVADTKLARRQGIVALAGLFILSRSSTLIALTVAWFLYRLLLQKRFMRAALFGLGITSLGLVAAAINYEAIIRPTAQRIVGIAQSSETDNVSSLVYVQGWQDAAANFKRTYGLGLGFNMMGCHPLPNVPARQILDIAGLQELNAQDGSFLFGKVVSEAGIAGIAFYIFIICQWIRLEKTIEAVEPGAERSAVIIRTTLIFCFVASSFLRSTGYFSGGMFLWVAAISGMPNLQSNKPGKMATASRLTTSIITVKT